MKTQIFLFGLITLFFFSPTVDAQTALNTPMNASSGNMQVGVVAAVKGKVELETPGKVGRVVESGQLVYLGDIVKTNEEGSLQLMLMDETVFTIGPNSAMTIDEYVYDPETHVGQISARVYDGVFRMITGKIPQKKPSNLKVKLPTGVMAVRGTMVYLTVAGPTSTGILGGPGDRHNTTHRVGRFEMQNEDANGNTRGTLVTKTGSASRIDGPGSAPSPAFDFPRDQYNQLKGSFGSNATVDDDEDDGGASGGAEGDSEGGEEGDGDNGSPMITDADDNAGDQGGDEGDYGDDGENVTEQSGQENAMGFIYLDDLEGFEDISSDLEDETYDAAEENAEEATGKIEDGISRLADLTTIETGVFHFKQTNVQLFHGGGASGTYDFFLDIDFGAETIGGGNSRIAGSSPAIDSQDSFQFDLFEQPFDASADGENGIFDYFSLADQGGSIQTALADVSITLNNSNGIAADNADHDVLIDDLTDFVEGSGNAPRQSGLSP